ncbi:MAG TPA: ABC transporter permease [Thermoleophilaceae bacterium]
MSELRATRRGRAASPAALATRHFRRDRAAIAWFTLLAALLLAFLAAPLYAEHVAGTSPSENHLSDVIVVDGKRRHVVSIDAQPIGPTWDKRYFLGADENGRDLAVRLLYGGRTSCFIGACALLLTILLATPLALAAGYFGGRTDSVVSRLLDVIWSFPALLLGVMLSTALALSGATIGPITIEAGAKVVPIAVIGIVYVPYVARPLRGQVMALRGQLFVEAARASGAGPARVMVSELLPHLWTTVLVLTPLMFANAIVLESALSFLGAGVAAPEPSFGVLISQGLGNVLLAPHLLLVPCIAMVLVVLALSGVADGLRRAFDPHGALGVDAVHGQ